MAWINNDFFECIYVWRVLKTSTSDEVAAPKNWVILPRRKNNNPLYVQNVTLNCALVSAKIWDATVYDFKHFVPIDE